MGYKIHEEWLDSCIQEESVCTYCCEELANFKCTDCEEDFCKFCFPIIHHSTDHIVILFADPAEVISEPEPQPELRPDPPPRVSVQLGNRVSIRSSRAFEFSEHPPNAPASWRPPSTLMGGGSFNEMQAEIEKYFKNQQQGSTQEDSKQRGEDLIDQNQENQNQGNQNQENQNQQNQNQENQNQQNEKQQKNQLKTEDERDDQREGKGEHKRQHDHNTKEESAEKGPNESVTQDFLLQQEERIFSLTKQSLELEKIRKEMEELQQTKEREGEKRKSNLEPPPRIKSKRNTDIPPQHDYFPLSPEQEGLLIDLKVRAQFAGVVSLFDPTERDWNEEFQAIQEESDSMEKFRKLSFIANEFERACHQWVRIILDDIGTPHPTLLPLQNKPSQVQNLIISQNSIGQPPKS